MANQDEKILMPQKLTAENGHKQALTGEFFLTITENLSGHCDCGQCELCAAERSGEDISEMERRIPIPWDSIKDIYKRVVEVELSKHQETSHTHKVTVSMNGLRKRLYYEMYELAKTLQQGIQDGYVSVWAEDIEEQINSLLTSVGFLACVYVEGDDKFTDLSEELNDDFEFDSQSE